MSLEELVREMYLHTPQGQRTLEHLERTVSHHQVRKAPVKKLSQLEQQRRMDALLRRITHDLATSPLSSDALREQLAEWQGARVRPL